MRAQFERRSDAVSLDAVSTVKLLTMPLSHLAIPERALGAEHEISFIEQLNDRANRRTRVLEEILSRPHMIVLS